MSDPHPIALVTGGGRGIGRAIAERLLADGWTVAVTWCSQREAAAALETTHPGTVRAFQLDLRDRERPARLVVEVEDALGPILALVNNAGVQRSELLAMTSDDSWDEVVDTNLGGAFRCMREVLRAMVGRRRGSIVNIASLSALHGVAGHAAYAASKAGIVAMTRCVAREMGRRNIRVNAVVPGYVTTDMTAGLSEQAVAALRSGECLRSGTPAEAVADAVAFLVSERAASITGQVLTVDAGTTA